MLVARSIGGGRVNVVGLRLPEDEDETRPALPPTPADWIKLKLKRVWSLLTEF